MKIYHNSTATHYYWTNKTFWIALVLQTRITFYFKMYNFSLNMLIDTCSLLMSITIILRPIRPMWRPVGKIILTEGRKDHTHWGKLKSHSPMGGMITLTLGRKDHTHVGEERSHSLMVERSRSLRGGKITLTEGRKDHTHWGEKRSNSLRGGKITLTEGRKDITEQKLIIIWWHRGDRCPVVKCKSYIMIH